MLCVAKRRGEYAIQHAATMEVLRQQLRDQQQQHLDSLPSADGVVSAPATDSARYSSVAGLRVFLISV